ncbi:MAG: GAF domain-containing protein [Ferrovum sp.]|nr:GAF domain-containing protein [Ferrovum sp.]NDU87138.1 GAF domain-containing protein [Ferrovum sp.]
MTNPLCQDREETALHAPEALDKTVLLIEPDKTLESLLDGFLETIIRTTGARAGAVRLFSISGNSLILGASRGLAQDTLDLESCRPLDCGICGQSLKDGQLHHASTNFCAKLHTSSPFFREECSQLIALPLHYRGHQLGMFTLFLDKDPVMGEALRPLLVLFAEMIGLAVENSRLSQDNQRIKLMAERQAIANEIHDSLSQSLFYGRLRMSALAEALRTKDEALTDQCLEDIGEALDSGQKSVRELIAHFRSPMDPLGLHHALQMLLDGLKSRSSIIFEYQHPRCQQDLSLEQEMQIFHILRECLNNLVLHSQCTHASVTITEDTAGLTFEVTDNGVGLDSLQSPVGHYGLTIMQERARRIGAKIFFHSAQGVGTQVRLFLPRVASLQE